MRFKEVPEASVDADVREQFFNALEPLFFPQEPHLPDIVQFASSVLRAGGIEDQGWDPFVESKATITDLFHLMKLDFDDEVRFPDSETTVWRLGLLFYNSIIEMDAPYEVIVNLLRYRFRKGFSLIPFDDFLTKTELKLSKKAGLQPHKKIEIISALGDEAGLPIRSMFESFYRKDLRNAVAHGSFVFTEKSFRARGLTFSSSFKIDYLELDRIINHAKIFFHVFYSLHEQCLTVFGGLADRFWGYDPVYKGIFEFLADQDGSLEGFKIHWPNGTDSYFRRGKNGNDCVNIFHIPEPPGLEPFVGMYARQADPFSPLVELGQSPAYTPIEKTGELPYWRDG